MKILSSFLTLVLIQTYIVFSILYEKLKEDIMKNVGKQFWPPKKKILNLCSSEEINTILKHRKGEYMMTEFSFFGWAIDLNIFCNCPMISFQII